MEHGKVRTAAATTTSTRLKTEFVCIRQNCGHKERTHREEVPADKVSPGQVVAQMSSALAPIPHRSSPGGGVGEW